MNAVPQTRMTVDEYLAWADTQPGRYELVDGTVHAMVPETAGHAECKAAVHAALRAGVRTAGIPCHALPDGMTVRIDARTAFEPDALVYCGQKLPPAATSVEEPVIVVEVLSPSTQRIDASLKLAGYFRVQSIVHYLIVDPAQMLVLHHRRTPDGTILTRIVREGAIMLDPPGLQVTLADIYAP